MKVNGKVRLIYRTKPGQETMYLTHEAKGHEIPLALANTLAAGGFSSTGGGGHLPTGLEVPLGANWTGIGATGDGAVVLQLTELVEL